MGNNLSNRQIAEENLRWFRGSSYRGHGVGQFISPDQKSVLQIGFIEGRSGSSQNRLLEELGMTGYRTVIADPAKAKGDEELILYQIMGEEGGIYVVTNGRHSDSLLEQPDLIREGEVHKALSKWKYEPDDHRTPRISGVAYYPIQDNHTRIYFDFSALKYSIQEKDYCRHSVWTYDAEMEPGYGQMLTTYLGNAPYGHKLPSFEGAPVLLEIESNDLEEVVAFFWEQLNPDYRVSICGKQIDLATRESRHTAINQYERV